MRWPCLLLLSACIGNEEGPSPIESRLLGLPGFTLAVRVDDAGLRVELTDPKHHLSEIECPQLLPSFVATLDGEPISFERGYIRDIGLDSPEYECVRPFVWTSLRGQQLHIADESVAFDIDLGDANGYRSMQLSTTTITRGDSLELTWSSLEDLANARDVRADVVLRTTGYELADAIMPDRVLLTMPTATEMPDTGNGPLVVNLSSTRTCPHLNCTISVSHQVSQAVTVQ
jgi:hypothetical protein